MQLYADSPDRGRIFPKQKILDVHPPEGEASGPEGEASGPEGEASGSVSSGGEHHNRRSGGFASMRPRISSAGRTRLEEDDHRDGAEDETEGDVIVPG